MKAAQINDYGNASVITVTEVETPILKQNQVLVKVCAASLNPFDTAIRSGAMQQMIPLQLPVTLGGDIAGEVVAINGDVKGVMIGDIVYGQANVVAGNSGAFAEYAAISADQITTVPSNLTLIEAAAMPLVGVSAIQGLVQHIKLQAGQKLLINGAGGIGVVAVQLAKHLGAYVTITATGDDIATVKALGADKIIDYKTEDFTQNVQAYDALFDTVGGDFTKSLRVLKKGGVAVSMAAAADETMAADLEVTAVSQATNITTDMLVQLRDYLESGVITPHIGKVFTLDAAQEAFVARESGTVRGKIVLEIKASS